TVPVDQAAEDADHPPHAHAHVVDRRADPDRRSWRLAFGGTFSRDAHESRVGLHEGVIAGEAGERSAPAEGGHGAVDEPRVADVNGLPVEAQLVERTGAEVV